ncbi:MAG TPA: flagellar protein FlgN [Candidatus Saccharimonadales bacterium]|nr:flagellar protein FlgN [Candidatus Saccharimonadales bacterium]
MQLFLEELSQILAEELRLYEELFSLSQVEQRLLVVNDTNSLDHSLVEMRAVVARLEALGERRMTLLGQLSEHTGIALEQLTLERLSELAQGATGVRLERLRSEFGELMGRLHRLNGQNLLLIRNSLDMTDRAVRLILGETGQVHFYGQAGQGQTASGPRILSRRM